MIYHSCATTCQPSCDVIGATCLFNCEETCKCSDDYRLEGTKCLALDDCGCQLPNGSYVKVQLMHIKDSLYTWDNVVFHVNVIYTNDEAQ